MWEIKILGHQYAEDLINRLYKRLFYLPRTTLLSMAYLFEGLSIAWLNMSATKAIYLSLIPSFLGLIIYLVLIYVLFIRGDAIDSFKKALGISLISLAPYIVVDLFASQRERFFLSFSSSSGMIFLVHYIFRGRIPRSFAIAITVSLFSSIVALYSVKFVAPSTGLSIDLAALFFYALITIISIAIIAMFIAVLELGGRASGMKTFETARGFLRAWLFEENHMLEEIFYRNSVKDSLRIRVFSIYRDGGDPIHLIYPGFHYGPFKRVGSSDAIYVFDRYIENMGHKAFIFHTIGSHERNIVLRSYVDRIARELSSKLGSRDPGYGEPLRGPIRVTKGSWTGFAIGGSDCIALHLSNINGSDDLPDSIEKIFFGIEKARGFLILAADSHGNYGRDSVNEGAIAEIAIGAIDSMASQSLEAHTMVGYGESYVDKPCRGMCSGRVKTLVFKNSTGEHVLIYLYGNNIHNTARRTIEDLIKSNEFKDYEVVTPDDHSCAAESLGTAYTAIHACNDLTRAIEDAIRKARSSLKESRVICREYIWDEAPFMGRIVWNYLKALEILGPITSKLWALTLIASIAVAAIVAYML